MKPGIGYRWRCTFEELDPMPRIVLSLTWEATTLVASSAKRFGAIRCCDLVVCPRVDPHRLSIAGADKADAFVEIYGFAICD